MMHDVTRTVTDVRIQTWRPLNAAALCQMFRAESDGPSTFHWTSDVSQCPDQVSDASFVEL